MEERWREWVDPWCIGADYYKCPECGKKHWKPLGQKKIRNYMRCERCGKSMRMEVHGETK